MGSSPTVRNSAADNDKNNVHSKPSSVSAIISGLKLHRDAQLYVFSCHVVDFVHLGGKSR